MSRQMGEIMNDQANKNKAYLEGSVSEIYWHPEPPDCSLYDHVTQTHLEHKHISTWNTRYTKCDCDTVRMFEWMIGVLGHDSAM